MGEYPGVRRLLVFVAALGAPVYLALSSFYREPAAAAGLVPEPTVRVAAEWEPVIGVLIGWPIMLPPALVVALAQEVDLYVTVCDGCSAQQAAAHFAAWGIAPLRVHFIFTAQGSGYYLPRDWGPFAVFDARGYRLVDSRFIDYPFGTVNHRHLYWIPRIAGLDYRTDDQAPLAVARTLGYPCTELPFALTGGNVLFDGRGTAFATEIMLDENHYHGISREACMDIARQGLGIQQFHFVSNFQRLGIQHIDCLMKLLDEERILVKRAPPDHPAAPYIERAICQLSRLTNVYGRPYEILRIDTPTYYKNKLANYTNALIVNRSIFVPLFGISADAAALETWRRAMPGYHVQGFEHHAGAKGWSTSDALHCRVRGIWDPGMLYLTHRRPDPVVAWSSRLTLAVHIRDYSGSGLVAERLQLAWRTAGSSAWMMARLHATGRQHVYQASIEGVPPGAGVEYYFVAASRSGRQETLPRTAPDGFCTFSTVAHPRALLYDDAQPTASRSHLESRACAGFP
jgi:agmatine/peptidylarginine deiminase